MCKKTHKTAVQSFITEKPTCTWSSSPSAASSQLLLQKHSQSCTVVPFSFLLRTLCVCASVRACVCKCLSGPSVCSWFNSSVFSLSAWQSLQKPCLNCGCSERTSLNFKYDRAPTETFYISQPHNEYVVVNGAWGLAWCMCTKYTVCLLVLWASVKPVPRQCLFLSIVNILQIKVRLKVSEQRFCVQFDATELNLR